MWVVEAIKSTVEAVRIVDLGENQASWSFEIYRGLLKWDNGSVMEFVTSVDDLAEGDQYLVDVARQTTDPKGARVINITNQCQKVKE